MDAECPRNDFVALRKGSTSDSPDFPSGGYQKRLILCCDGTWNDSISTDSPLTNVSRITRCIPAVSNSGIPQIVLYYSGVGSGTSKAGKVIDGMTRRGISAIIRDSYTFICHNHSGEQDEIILIGFSRGAFAVRSVAAFITEIGLLRKAGLNYLITLYKLWSKQRKIDVPSEESFTDSASRPSIELSHTSSSPPLRKEVSRSESLKSLQERLCRKGLLQKDVRIKVCAVWDTVGSLGLPMPGPVPQKTSKKLCFVDSTLPKNIEFAIQALALNERRRHFQPTIWQDNGVTALKQCWFLGAHSNVGGGYEDTGLANLAQLLVDSSGSRPTNTLAL
ncbi:hypothetical protein BJX62DRAFT_245232 [Aspergillus germanicus]